MYLVIAGQHGFAVELAKLILAKGQTKVALIVRDKDIAVQLSNSLNAIVVNADATDTKTLDELNLKECDAFIAATDSEKTNVLSALYAKNAGAKKIFVKVDNPESESILEKLGFVPIMADHFAARTVELMITRPAVSDLVNIGIGQFDIIEMQAKGTKLIGKELSSAKGKHYTTIATCSESKYCFTKEKKIDSKETVILLVDSGKEKEVEKELK